MALVFLKLGVVGFGGPAAHLALMRDEVVTRRRWMEEQEFVDALGVTSALPGPGSTQMAMVAGRRRAGWAGLLVSGVCFILPAFVLVLGLVWAYVHYGRTTVGSGLLYGLGPAVIAVLANALWVLSRVAVRSLLPWALSAAALGLFLAGVDVLVILAGAAAVSALWRNFDSLARRPPAAAVAPLLGSGWLAAAHHLVRPRTAEVALEFLKLGVVVFGSGYVLFAYLRHDLVSALGWLTPASSSMPSPWVRSPRDRCSLRPPSSATWSTACRVHWWPRPASSFLRSFSLRWWHRWSGGPGDRRGQPPPSTASMPPPWASWPEWGWTWLAPP